MEPVIQINSVVKRYSSQVLALKNLSLEIKPREIYGLLGPNGSGKTTTIKLILGLIHPSEGEILVFGMAPGCLSTRYKMGYQPEDSYFYPFLNAYETLDFYGQLYGIPRKSRKKRIDHLLKVVGLSEKDGRRKVGEYSKGMARRIALAQALINDPPLLILDEPTAGLDPLGSRELKDLMFTLKEEGKTILLSSHLLADVADICDRIVILYQGEMVREGDVKTLLSSEKIMEIHLQNFQKEHEGPLKEFCEKNHLVLDQIRPLRENLENIFLKTIQDKKDETSGSH